MHAPADMHKLLYFLLFVSLQFTAAAQSTAILNYIKDKSDIKEGGSGLYKFKNDTYLITVVSLPVGAKNESACKQVGSAKAKRDMLAYVNGSEISSYTELVTSENVIDSIEGKSATQEQKYIETIKETVLGTINEINPLGSWYSDDRSVYYFAIYKTVQ